MKGSDRLVELNMVENGNMEEGDQNEQQFALLMRVTQLNDKPLLIGGCTGRAMSQMLHEVAGEIPNEVVVMNDQERMME